jgi:exopolysaccharide biosynthesis polyprenyl glycosylphosphotransferase
MTTYAPGSALGETAADLAAVDVHRLLPERSARGSRAVPAAADLTVVALVVGAGELLLPGQARAATLAGGLTWLAALAACGAWVRSPGRRSAVPVLQAAVASAAISWFAAATVLPAMGSSNQVLLTALLVTAGLLTRLLVRTWAPTRVVLAGDIADVRSFLQELRHGPGRDWRITSVCVDADDPVALDADLHDLPVRIGTDAAIAAARATGATSVVVLPGRAMDPAAVRRASWAAHEAGLDVYVGTGLLDVQPHRVQHVSVGRMGLARVGARWAPSIGRTVKHGLDRTLAGVALVLLSPLLAAIVLAVRWDSPGGAFYTQRRTGPSGSPFTMYKFRTMRNDADRQVAMLADRNDCDAVLFKMREDPRVTRVGRVLRRYSLDELPQLLNVLRGEMSLVGPRPALPAEVAKYEPDERHRLAVRPGLTGLWQVSGRSDLSWDESVRLDLHYVDNWSWALDLRILVRTVGAVVGHRGAY